jgi:Lysozyme like domain
MAMLDFSQLKALWVQAGGDPTKADIAAAVALAESGGPPYKEANSDAISSAGARGLWQIMPFHGSVSSLDPLTNARGAVQISNNGQSWRAWDSAFSDNLRGTKGGTYLGAGSMVLRALQANGGSLTGSGTGGTGTGGVQQAGAFFPSEITTFFADAAKLFSAFFKPSTYVRIGAGLFGTILLIFGVYVLGREAFRNG